jgi:signal transduction histidine kinase
MPETLQLLVIEDRPDDAELLVHELHRAGFECPWSRADRWDEIEEGLDRRPDLILCDYTLPGITALDVLRFLGERGIDIPLIVVSGVMDEQTCVDSLRLGAADYLLKDRLTRLGPAVRAALERRRLAVEAQRAREEERTTSMILQGLVDHAPAAIGVQSLNGVDLLANPAFTELRPHLADRLAMGPPDRDLLVEEVVSGANGQERTYLAHWYPVADSQGRPFAVGSIHLDITHQKQVEAHLLAARQELTERAERLDAANAELRELDRMKDEFIASVSHELRTPLTSIRGYIELLLDAAEEGGGPAGGAPVPAPRSALEVIDRNSKRLLRLIEELLLLAHIQPNASEALPAAEFPLSAATTSAEAMLRPAATAACVRLKFDVPETLPLLCGDPHQVERVVVNLVNNAVKFSRTDTQVRVRGRREGSWVVLEVADQGVGISEADLPKVFDRFWRADSARREEIQGTGLGLAVVRQILDRHGGRIDVRSVVDEGSTFTVRLPAVLTPAGRGGPADSR